MRLGFKDPVIVYENWTLLIPPDSAAKQFFTMCGVSWQCLEASLTSNSEYITGTLRGDRNDYSSVIL